MHDSEIREGLWYLASHEWGRLDDDGTVTIGLSDHIQDTLGEVLRVQTPSVGDHVRSQEEVGRMVTSMTVVDLYSLVSGVVVAVNEALLTAPRLVNESPYGDGWLFRVRPDAPSELEDALSADDYRELLAWND